MCRLQGSGPGQQSAAAIVMIRRSKIVWSLAVLAAAIAALSLVSLKSGVLVRRSRYNVLLITLDTTRADRFSSYGYALPTTPNMDGIAATGVRFERAIAQSAATPISHASIMTGLYPYHHGVRVIAGASSFKLPDHLPTLAGLLQAGGWRTAAFVSSFTASPYYGFQRGFQHFDSGIESDLQGVLRPDPAGHMAWNMVENQRRSDATTDRALQWIGENPGPFFIWLHYWDPHDLRVLPPEKFIHDFAPQLPRGYPRRLFYLPNGHPADPRRMLYDAEVRYVDSQIGRLIGKLKATGSYQQTLIVVVADHGEGLGDHNWCCHRVLYQEQIRVPLILRLPGGPSGKVVPDLVRTVDILPTVLDWLGIDPIAPLDGRSLRPLLEDKPDPPRLAYAEQLNDIDSNWQVKDKPEDGLLYCMMDRTWKLVYRARNPDSSELFNLRDDPAELKNLFHTHRGEAEKLRLELERSTSLLVEAANPLTDPAVRERLRSLGYVER